MATCEREYKQRNEKVKLQVVAFTAAKFRSGVNVTDADIAAHFEAHKAEYRIGEQRKIKYLLLDRDQARLKVTVPPTDIQRYYNDNIQQFQTPEQVKASHILLKTDGKDEAAVRKQAEGILAQVKGGARFRRAGQEGTPRTKAPRPTAATSTTSAAAAWCRSSRPPRSRCSRARSAIW